MSGASAKNTGKSENARVHEHRGLCSTCSLASGCTFPRHPQIPVMHCDEFMGYEYKPAVREEKFSRRVYLVEKKTELPAGESIGLCRNCKHRDGCRFPKPTRGVLCCDEYE